MNRWLAPCDIACHTIMQKNPFTRLLIIVFVLLAFFWAMYPMHKKLKPGLDLVGGTQLLYHVDIPEGQDAKTVIDQVIDVLRTRIDPDGVMNLIWRQQAGHRIEIQVPLAPANVQVLRDTYTEARKKLLSSNTSRRQLIDAIRLAGSVRDTQLDKLARGDDTKRNAFAILAQSYDALQSARGPKDQVLQQLRELELRIKLLAGDAPPAEKQQLQVARLELIEKIAKPTRAFNDAQQDYQKALVQALTTNVSEFDLDMVMGLPNRVPPKSRQKPGEEGKTLREVGLAFLIKSHPTREAEIRVLLDHFAAYEAVKGPIDDPNDLIKLLQGSGVLEFRIAPSPNQLPDEQDYRDQLTGKGPRAGRDKDYRWFLVDDIDSYTDRKGYRKELDADPQEFFRLRQSLVGQAYVDQYYILLGNTEANALTASKRDWKLKKALRSQDEMGMAAVQFLLNPIGGHLMGDLTGAHVGKPMAIVLDKRVISTPTLQSKINARGVITGGSGGFSQEELSYLIRTLNAGSLTGSLSKTPISRKTTGPNIGEDNLNHGVNAAVWALVLVAIFMAVYYLLWGCVANFALAANMVIILGAMAAKQASFTLPGIAGIILTIGMAVDANVLIFERIREELGDGADFDMAVRLGFEKAFSTIIDANITTLIICFVLYHTATAEIKGFALTLGIGIAATLFTALYCSRTLIEVYVRITGKKTFAMLPTMVPAINRLLHPKVNWVGKRRAFLTASAILMTVGLLLTVGRGEELLDIEFRSGTQVGFQLKDGATLSLPKVRDRLDKAATTNNLPELKSGNASVVTVGEVMGDQASGFNIAVLSEDTERISAIVKDVFADVLDTQRSIHFTGADAANIGVAPVRIVEKSSLGDNIDRPEVMEEVSDYLGGVVFVLEQLNPPATELDLTERIERMRLQPQFEDLGFRQFRVIGLEVATDVDLPAGDDFYYRSVAIVSTDGATNYVENAQKFDTDPEGLAISEWQLIHDALLRDTSLDSVTKFSSQVSSTMKWQAIQAMVYSLLAVVAYIWLRFGSLRYGLAAIVALLHDVVISLGLLAISYYVFETFLGQALMISDFKINLAVVAALLTIVGYSLNDTIVVFDRIRENRGRLTEITPDIVNNSINQTISRTVITSGTTLLAVATLYIFGGDGVHGFAFTLLTGVLVGTYSSVAIASPILLMGKGLPSLLAVDSE